MEPSRILPPRPAPTGPLPSEACHLGSIPGRPVGPARRQYVVVVAGGASTNIGEVDLVGSGQVAGVVRFVKQNAVAGALVTVTDTTTHIQPAGSFDT